jgi:hypothetical protein
MRWVRPLLALLLLVLSCGGPPLESPPPCTWTDPNGAVWRADPAPFRTDANLGFETVDCSGPAYLLWPNHPAGHVVASFDGRLFAVGEHTTVNVRSMFVRTCFPVTWSTAPDTYAAKSIDSAPVCP